MPDDEAFLETLIYSFEQRYNGNRSPLSVNGHTDYYSQYNPYDDPEFGCQDYTLRRQAIEDFMDYVMEYDEVRIVPFVKVLQWMSDPVAHDVM